MRVMVIVKATKNSEAGVMPSEKLLAEMGKYNEELVKAGIMLAGDGLHPSSKGKRVRFAGGKKTVVDGPFAETKELVAGYWIWQVKSMDEAVEWVQRCPDPMPGEESRARDPPGLRGRGLRRGVHPRAARAGRAPARRDRAQARQVTRAASESRSDSGPPTSGRGPDLVELRHVHLRRHRVRGSPRGARARAARSGSCSHLLVGHLREQVVDAVEARLLLVDRLHHPPGRLGDVGALEHDLLGPGVVLPAPARLQVHRAELPLLERVVDARRGSAGAAPRR